MRPINEWFKPEKLTTYYFVFEAGALLAVLAVVGVLAYTGVLWEVEQWVVLAGAAVVLATFGFVTWWIPAFYRSADYRLTDDEIDYRRGVFFRHRSTVPYNRITNVDAAQGPVQRIIGAGQVGVHTAGYGGQMGAELTIDGVADFDEIKDQILDRVRQRAPAATETELGVQTPPGPAREAGDDEVLGELRRIRELLERGPSA